MICIINGPNLNLTGRRQPEIYGAISFETFLRELREKYPSEPIEYFQSNSEGSIIDRIHQLGYDCRDCKGIIINPGAYAHYSYAIADALNAVEIPAIEVHLSNIHAREEFRAKSVTASACTGIIAGLGLKGYEMALEYLIGK